MHGYICFKEHVAIMRVLSHCGVASFSKEEILTETCECRGEQIARDNARMGNLASTYWNQGLWKETEELGMQVMETRKRVKQSLVSTRHHI